MSVPFVTDAGGRAQLAVVPQSAFFGVALYAQVGVAVTGGAFGGFANFSDAVVALFGR